MSSNGRPATFEPDKDHKKSALDRINATENYFGELCSVTSSFTKKTARIRDKYDDLGRVLRNVGDLEMGNESFSDGLINYAKAMTLLADVTDIEVQRLQTKVVLELAAYESFCKNQRDALKHSISLREKEASRQQHLDQMRQRSQQRGAQSTANINTNKPVKGVLSKSGTDVDELIKRFEMQKMQDVKTILLNLTAIQLKQHAKAIELLSAAYQDIADIDEENEVEEFADQARTKDDRSLKTHHRSQSVGALSSLLNGSQLKAKNVNLSASTISVDSPQSIAGKILPQLSPAASLDSPRKSITDISQTEDESDSRTDDDAEERKGQPNASSTDEDEADNDNKNQINQQQQQLQLQQRKAKLPPVAQVRFSKLGQQASTSRNEN